jgi:alpha-glucosidase
MYYGEEIGMKTTPPTRKEDVKDPIGQKGWPKEKGRDGERTPMQWDASANAGFSKGTPWLPVPPTYKTHNVADESKEPDSILEFYKKVLKLRHTNEALMKGDYTAINESDPKVLSYLRTYKDQTVVVALNMSAGAQTLKLEGYSAARRLVSTNAVSSRNAPARKLKAEGGTVSLEPFGVYIGELTK